MDILKCKCMLYPTEMKIEDSLVGTLFGYECKRCGKSARAQSPIMAATLWNDKHGAQSKPLCLKCGKFTPVKDGDLCSGCMRKFPLIKVDAPTVGDGRCGGTQSDYHKAKHDAGKLRLDLIPPSTYDALGRVMQYGAGLYGENTWQHLPEGTKRCHAALLRHLVAWHGGEKVDPESGLPHLEHVLWNAAALVEFEK